MQHCNQDRELYGLLYSNIQSMERKLIRRGVMSDDWLDENGTIPPEYVRRVMVGQLHRVDYKYATAERLLAEREKFIEEHVEGPCRKLTRALMDMGKVTVSSNAFNKVVPKGVWWVEAADYFAAQAAGAQRPENKCTHYLTDLNGQTTALALQKYNMVSQPVNFDMDVSEFLPTESDYHEWIASHPGVKDADIQDLLIGR